MIKSRKKKKFKEPLFEKGTCLTFKLKNGNHGGAVVLYEKENGETKSFPLTDLTRNKKWWKF
jgi:hypothetical protein